MNFQMMRVISSPSISTTGFFTLIFAMCAASCITVRRACVHRRCGCTALTGPNDYGAGTFDEGPCDQGDALGRCVLMPGYRARRYHYTGFEGVPSPDDPGNNALEAGCELSGGVYERPPFAD